MWQGSTTMVVKTKKINNNLVDNRCPWCRQREIWEYVTLYKGVEDLKRNCLQNLEKATRDVKSTDHIMSCINLIFLEIKNHINNNIEEWMNATQSIVGIKNIFRDWITKK